VAVAVERELSLGSIAPDPVTNASISASLRLIAQPFTDRARRQRLGFPMSDPVVLRDA
jgi:hypothetical protein